MELQKLRDACKVVLEDCDFCAGEERCMQLKEMTSTIMRCCAEEHNLEFGKWLYSTVHAVIVGAQGAKIDPEILWSNFHAVRSAPEFSTAWEGFLKICGLSPEPVLYQHISLVMLKELVKATSRPAEEEEASGCPTVLTYEEVSAIKYVGGYLVRSLRDDFPESELKFLTIDKNTSTSDWIKMLDRGGLIHITESFCEVLCAMEYVIRQHVDFNRDKIQGAILDDSDVLFYWCVASPLRADNDEHVKGLISIAKKYLTIRGFSFSRSVLEKYKQENKKNTSKSKPLRRKVTKDD